MLEITYLLAGVSVFLLVAAAATWFGMARLPMLQPLDRRLKIDRPEAEMASKLLVFSVVGGILAAMLAIIGWIIG